MNVKNQFFLCFLLCTIVSCGSKEKSAPLTAKVNPLQTTFIHGDPRELIKGSTTNQKSFISKDNFSEFNNYSLYAIRQYAEKEALIQKADTQQSAETGTEAPESEGSTPNDFFSFKKEGALYIYSNPNIGLKFIFSEEDGALQFKSIEVGAGVYNLDVIHYSKKKSNDAFSILAELQDKDDGRTLFSFVFIKTSEQRTIRKVPETFKYSMGSGVAFSWPKNQPVQIDVCGNLPRAVEAGVNYGLTQWKNSLDKRLAITSNILQTYPPFSDLNTHCIYLVQSYLVEADIRYSKLATTTTVFDGFQGTILDSDIFVWKKEIEKRVSIESSGVAPLYKWVMTHELGHFFGLNHQFDANYKSVMSYDIISELTSYDNDAVWALYPL